MPEIGDIVVRIRADLTDLNRSLGEARKSIGTFGQGLREAGTSLTAFLTVPIAGLGVAAGKAAVDFETSFAGIRKTMDLTEAEFGRLAKANRDLAKEIPVAVNELNRIGELAGQLGIEGVDNVLKFEETIAQLAVTTDLTADEAALAFARIANVIQLPQEDIPRLGAAVVALGNNFATVESEIVEFTTRIAGAGQIAGLTAGDIAGIATAFSSVGVGAEAGGTAVQKVLLSMQQAVVQGGADLEQFAATAGLSAQGFADAFEADAGRAFTRFVEGLGAQGDEAIRTLDELGLVDQRLVRGFLAVAGAGDVMRRAIAEGNRGFAENSALTEEAAKRFETAASQIQLFVNRLRDVAITLGSALVPALLSALNALEPLIGAVGSMADTFAALPQPIQLGIIAIAGLAAAIGPVLLVIGQLAIGIAALSSAMAAIGPVMAVAGVAIAAITGPIGLVIAAVAGMTAAWILWGEDIDRISQSTRDAVVRSFDSLVASLDSISVSARDAVVGAFTSMKDQALAAVNALVEGVRGRFSNVLAGAVARVKAQTEAITGAFRSMFNAVVGNSYVPDLIDGIAAEFGRLDSVMVGPAQRAAGLTTQAFSQIRMPTLEPFQLVPSVADRAVTGQLSEPPGFLDQTWRDINGAIQEAGGSLQVFGGGLLRVLDDTISGFGGFFDNLKRQITTTFSQIGSSIGGVLGGAVGGIIGGLVGGVIDFIGGLFGGDEPALDPAGQLINEISTGLKETEQATDVLKEAIERIRNTLEQGGPGVDVVGRSHLEEILAELEEQLAGVDGLSDAVEETTESFRDLTRNVPTGFRTALSRFDATIPGFGPRAPELSALGEAVVASRDAFHVDNLTINAAPGESGESLLARIEGAVRGRQDRGGGGLQLAPAAAPIR